jgi:hypothetical protein
MKKLFFLTSLLFAAAFFSQSAMAQTEAQKIELCTKVAGTDATLEQSYPVQLPAVKDGERAPTFKKAMAMRKGNRYRFTICTDEESAGEAIMDLFDEQKKAGSTFIPETGKTYRSFDFDCSKTGAYVIIVSFKDGKEGSAVGILSHVKTL